MNAWPMRRRFSCGSVTPAKRRQELVLRLDDVQIGLEVVGELADHRFLFVFAQQSVIDQDAGQLRADGLGQAARRRPTNRRRRTARRSPDRRPRGGGRFDGFAGEIAQLPRAGAAADALRKLPRIFAPCGRVGHLGMELQRRRSAIGGASPRRRGRCRWRPADSKSAEVCRHLIAVAHPHLNSVGHARPTARLSP